MPFSTGPYACIGRQLAYMELRTVLAKILLAFDVTFAPNEDGKRLLESSKDYFLTGAADFQISISLREKSASATVTGSGRSGINFIVSNNGHYAPKPMSAVYRFLSLSASTMLHNDIPYKRVYCLPCRNC